MKICQVIFSTNRLEYLIPTLRSQRNLNFFGCEVHKIFIDDFPKTRNDMMITELVKLFGYEEIILHEENKGLSVTWSEFWDLIKDRDYDYVYHQEDDVVLLEPVLITDLVEILERDSSISQVHLARQAWYPHEKDPVAEDSDIIYKNYRYQKSGTIFSPMASLYSIDKTRIDYRQFHNYNLNEGLVGNVLYNQHQQMSAGVKNYYGKNIINHIGNWFVGKRVLPGEPNYEQFAMYDPNIKYNSRDGSLWK
jgi:GT2 family glycosyltransferase